MKCKTKKLISVAASLALIVTSVFAQDIHSRAAGGGIAINNISSGTYGDAETIEYLYYKGAKAANSFLVLEGSGEMSDLPTWSDFKAPFEAQGWYEACLSMTAEQIDSISDWTSVMYDYLSEILIGGEISNVGAYTFYYQYNNLNTIRLGKKITQLSEGSLAWTSCTDIYIYGEIETVDDYAFDGDMATIHVATEASKQKIEQSLDNCGNGDCTVVCDLTVDDTPLRIALKKGTIQQNMHENGAGFTTGSWSALTTAMEEGQTLLDATDATEDAITAKAAAIDNAIAGLVTTDVLDQAIAEAEKLSGSDYTSDTWAVLQQALEAGKTGRKEAGTPDEINKLATAIDEAIDGLVKLTADVAKAELDAVVAQTTDLVESDYTESSWTALQEALTQADSVAQSDVISEIAGATEALQKALDALVVDYPAEWFSLAGIPSSKDNWNDPTKITILSGKVDSEMAGAQKVEVTFDCTAKTSYNPYASIDIEMGDAYERFIGTDSNYQLGGKGWKETLELTSALKEGAAYDLKCYTFAWESEPGNVYTIQSVKFLDADDNVLKSVDAPKGIADLLNPAIQAAEEQVAAITTSDYTEESVAAMNTSIENVKNMDDVESLLPSQVNAILAELEDVTSALVPYDNAAVMKELNANIEKAEALNKDNYTIASWTALEKAVADAKKATDSTVISEIEALNQAVLDAIAGLKETEPSPTKDPNATPDPGATKDPNATPDPGATKDPNATTNPNATKDPTQTTAPNPTKKPGGSVGTKPTKAPVTVKKPGKAAIKKVTAKKKTVTLKLKKKLSGVTSYQVVISTNKKFKKSTKVTVKNVKKLKFKLKYKKLKLKKGKKYYIKIRAVKKSGGKTLYGKYSAVKKFKAK